MSRTGRKWSAAVLVAVLFGGLTVVVAGPALAGGGGSCHNPKHLSGSGLAVDAKEICFLPTVLHVKEGTTVTWTNRDPVPHSVTGLADAWGTRGKNLQQGDSVSVEFSDPGVYPYTCILHPGMVGAVVVGEPTAAKAAAAESASIPIGRPSAPAAGAEAGPAQATAATNSDRQWPWLFAGILVLGAMAFLLFDVVRGRKIRSVA